MKSRFGLNATMVANEFIDRYMAVANGEYVKVYLYVLRHQETEITVSGIADALNHTEADVRRALAYWVRLGVLAQEHGTADKRSTEELRQEEWTRGIQEKAGQSGLQTGRLQMMKKMEAAGAQGQPEYAYPESVEALDGMGIAQGGAYGAEASARDGKTSAAEAARTAGYDAGYTNPGDGAAGLTGLRERIRYTPEQVGQLAKESEFTQLLYISQKYMNKVFTPKECEVFAYLYDGLHMPVELLEYLVEYCVQGDHCSIRYLETVALNWHEQGINTVDKARQHTASFSKETFSVMKAFGLSDRRPGDAELAAIQRWFREWGFSRELVLEACGRTLKATHKPSFSYADKILAEWRKAGVKTMADVKKQDARREGRKAAQGAQGNQAAARPFKNQFHNFEQRNTNYDAMVLERLKQRLGES